MLCIMSNFTSHLTLFLNRGIASRGATRRLRRQDFNAMQGKTWFSACRAKTEQIGSEGVKLVSVHWPLKMERMLGYGQTLQVAVNTVSHYFDPILLRDSCQCETCVDPDSGQKKFNTTDLNLDISISQSTRQMADGKIKIYWRQDLPGWPSDHKTTLPPLFFIRNSRRSRYARSIPYPFLRIPWVAKKMKRKCEEEITYYQFMHNESDFQRAVRQLAQYGLVILKQTPKDELAVEHIAERIGPVKETFYGRTWDVKDKPKAENVAYTSGHLGLHMDLLYMKQPPGLQLLHCLQTSDQGGASVFSDAVAAALIVANVSREAFQDLATFPVSYRYRKNGFDYMDSKTVIELDQDNHMNIGGDVALREIAHINWSPPFQAPFRGSLSSQDQQRRLQSWLRAAKVFDFALNDPRAVFNYRMEEGDCAIFNNRRVVHGRTAFSSNVNVDMLETGLASKFEPDSASPPPTKVRWLKGAYIEMDDFDSKVRDVARNMRAKPLGESSGGDEDYAEEKDLNNGGSTLPSGP